MRLSDLVRKVEDAMVSATKVVVADGKAACDAIKANHAKKAEKPVVEPQKEEVKSEVKE